MALISRVAGLETTQLRIQPDCPGNLVNAGDTHEFEYSALMSFKNDTGAEVQASVKMTIGAFSQVFKILEEHFTIAVGQSKLKTIRDSYQMYLTPGSKAIKVEVRIESQDSPPQLIGSKFEYCNFFVQ